LSAAKKVAGLAESFDAELIPHGALSSVATAIAVQLDACIPNFVLQDYLGDDQPPKNDFLVENLRLEDGYLIVPERPGIGVELKPGLAERYPPTLRRPDPALHEDGSVADR
jgi:galactonate dehydratase